MEYADILPFLSVIEQLPAAIGCEGETVGIGVQYGQLEVTFNAVIGIPDKDIVGLVIGMMEGDGAIMAKVEPGIVRNGAGNPLFIKEGFDEVLGIVGGARIADNIGVELNVGPEVVKGVYNDMRLILHNHIQAYCLLCRQFHCL